MPFNKEHVIARARSIVESLTVPGTSHKLLNTGIVERLSAHEGQLNVIINPGPDLGEQVPAIKREIARALGEIEGVEQVSVFEKVRQPEGAPRPELPPQRRIPGVANIVAIASGKGGVGKSTVAVNLAVGCAALGRRVGLLDSDIYGPSVPTMMGSSARPEVLGPKGRERIQPIERHGVATISMGNLVDTDMAVIWRGPLVTAVLRQLLYEVEWGELDLLVVDLPPGTGDAQLTLVQSVPLLGGIIVTTPQEVALLDVTRGVQMFQRVKVPVIGVIENMSFFVCPECGHRSEIFGSGGGRRSSERFGVPLLGEIPLDPAVRDLGDRGIPIVTERPDSPQARTFTEICRTLLGKL